MKNYLFTVGIIGLLIAGCGGTGGSDVDCGDAVAIDASTGPVCVIEGDLLIETGFSCPEELHYQHEYGGYAVCSSSPELGDDVRRTIDGMRPAAGLEGGACVNVFCRLGETCVDGRCVADIDSECLGGVCERSGTDSDGDGVEELRDNCPGIYNPDQIDSDGDGTGDLCDELTDSDGDGVYDRFDNCPRRPNPAQTDADRDGVGDV